MRKAFIAAALAAAVAVAADYAGASQHRKPNEPAPEGPQTAQPRQPPQASPRPDRPRRGPERGPVIVPYPGWPWWGYPYGYPPTWRVYAEWETASVRLDVSPNESEVYVDGYFAGVVDDFDGIFQRLTLRPGPHLIDVRKSGYRSLAIEVNLYPGQSITYRRTMAPSSDLEGRALETAPGFEEGAATPADYSVAPGDVRFDVTPDDAVIYADGFYAGIVDDFNGSQHLRLGPGRHRLSIRLDGYESVDVDVTIDSGRTITYRASLKRRD